MTLVQNSREFHEKRVSYFAKKYSLFCEISCFAKLAFACESKFRIFRISRNRALSYETKRNETTNSNGKKLFTSN